MERISKSLALTLILIISLTIVGTSSAQTIPKPSVPEFTIGIADHSYDIPPTYGIDQFTGQNITIQQGAHYQWKTINFTITNQPAPQDYGLYYNIRYKGQYTNNWTQLYYAETYISQQSGQYTIIPFLISRFLSSKFR